MSIVNSPNYAIPKPDANERWAKGNEQIAAVVDKIDPSSGVSLLTPYTSGVLGSRPTSSGGTPGIAGRRYRDSGTGVIWTDYGTGWQGEAVHRRDVVANLGTATSYPPGSTLIATDENNIEYTQINGAWVWTRGEKAWTNLSMDAAGNWAAVGGDSPQVRLTPDSAVEMRGRMIRSSGGDSTPLGTAMAAAFHPAVSKFLIVGSASAPFVAASMEVDPSGVLFLGGTGSSTATVYLEGLRYYL